ncbi:Bacterial extracellular solute-binding protein [Pseudovibrio axinellae]|uniref:Bacterial extracellular solute-binding protein n=1 Tax=Pseudovibrio axinellae TaxID=989403 RepID=A0A165XNY5_9HYPH|nr:ABC transporter substrate-binding protein [Pseudovibrio axinellae]KZL17901.1 Bacterial extracellular solute-binding protein [Pseudovibrio axinellae]SER58433.1 iron(III) transport system substrate-binding protein [Pseudovibrio axinellae]
MRILLLPTILISFALWLMPAVAYEIEQHKLFPASAGGEGLRIISNSDSDIFSPLIEAFQRKYPTVSVDYTVVSSTELMRAVYEENAAFDIAISSAMDLQVKLANDGYTRPHNSEFSELLPDWARWRNHVFAFTQEPASVVYSKSAFEGLEIPTSRQSLISILRNNGSRFKNKVGTYDIRQSGLGFLFATQDARNSDTFWRLNEVMGSLNAKLYCCSADMISGITTGELAVAYNVLGSYAQARAAKDPNIGILALEDFTTLMLRSAIIPTTAENPDIAGAFIDHLITASWSEEGADYYPYPKLNRERASQRLSLRTIRLGPGLLVYLDNLKRSQFLQEWQNAIIQP